MDSNAAVNHHHRRPAVAQSSHSPMDRLRQAATANIDKNNMRLRSKSPFTRAVSNDGTSSSSSYPPSESQSSSSSSCNDMSMQSHLQQGLNASSSDAATAGLRHRRRVSAASVSGSVYSSVSKSSGNTSVASRRFLSSDGSVELDSNGCCLRHPFVQLQRPTNGNGGWRIMSRTCALCVDEAEEREKVRSLEALQKADAALASIDIENDDDNDDDRHEMHPLV